MTLYSLWQTGTGSGTSGGPLSAYTATPIIVTNLIATSGAAFWLQGYYIWVPTGGDTAPSGGYKCALRCQTTQTTDVLVPGSAVTSTATMTANAWNYIPLSTPVQIAPGWDKNLGSNGGVYIVCIGWIPAHGFADSVGFWGSAPQNDGVTTGGKLIAYGSVSPFTAPYTSAQGLFSTSGATGDPATTDPLTTGSISANDNYWVDVLISDSPPNGYTGSFRIWPNKYDANAISSGDQAINFTIATEIDLSQPCTLNNVWYFSPNGSGGGGSATTLATRCDIWNIASGAPVTSIPSPSWLTPTGGAASAGSGWVKAAFPAGVTLGVGNYRVSIYNANGTADANWNSHDAGSDYYGQTLNGVAQPGILSGPLTAPGWNTSQGGFFYDTNNPGGTPNYSGSVTAHAQPPFGRNQAGTPEFPQLYAPLGTASNTSQNYWVDLEATVLATAAPQATFAYLQRRV